MFVGIDVAKAELVVSILPGAERFTVANDERGVRMLVERMRTIGPQLIVLEATGGYELLSVAALAASLRRRTASMRTSSRALRILAPVPHRQVVLTMCNQAWDCAAA